MALEISSKNLSPLTQGATCLILVCCHGIWLGGPTLGEDENEWLIAPFQQGETTTFIEHIKTGLHLLSSTPKSLLIFSGGPTRPETSISEAESYFRLAQAHDYWGLLSLPDLKAMVALEKRALDSFHNLLFSLTQFYTITTSWPEHITIISNKFKRARFLDLHCKAIRWPLMKATFVGIDPWYMAVDLERAASVREGERKNGFLVWERDMYGVGEELEEKRRRRNPWQVKQSLFEHEEFRDHSRILSVMSQERELLDVRQQPWEQ